MEPLPSKQVNSLDAIGRPLPSEKLRKRRAQMGGRARALSLDPERRKQIAAKGGRAKQTIKERRAWQ